MKPPREMTGTYLTADAIDVATQLLAVEVARALHDRAHYWVAVLGFRVTEVPPIGADILLDHENFRVPPEVGCFICEQAHGHATARCPGPP